VRLSARNPVPMSATVGARSDQEIGPFERYRPWRSVPYSPLSGAGVPARDRFGPRRGSVRGGGTTIGLAVSGRLLNPGGCLDGVCFVTGTCQRSVASSTRKRYCLSPPLVYHSVSILAAFHDSRWTRHRRSPREARSSVSALSSRTSPARYTGASPPIRWSRPVRAHPRTRWAGTPRKRSAPAAFTKVDAVTSGPLFHKQPGTRWCSTAEGVVGRCAISGCPDPRGGSSALSGRLRAR